MEKFVSIVKGVDLNGTKPCLFINQKETSKTFVIGLLNIIFIIIAIASCVYFGLEMVDLQKPEVSFVQEYDRIPQDYIINYENFNIMVDIQSPYWESYINNSIYKIEGKFNRLYSNGTFLQTDIPLKPCSEDLFGQSNRELYRSTNTKNNWCIDKLNAPNITLRGTFNNPEYQFFGLYISACKNDSSNINSPCASHDVIDTYLNGGFFSTRYIDNLIDSKNFTTPYFKILKDTFYSISNRYFKEVSFYFKNIDIMSENGFLLENWINQRFIQLGEIKENMDLRAPSGTFFNFIIRLQTTREIINRRYLKIQTVIANVGGILKFFSVIIGIINSYYGNHRFYERLYNHWMCADTGNKVLDIKKKEYRIKPSNNQISKNIMLAETNINVINFIPMVAPCVNSTKRINDSSKFIRFNFIDILFCLKFLTSKKRSNVGLLKTWINHYKNKLSVYRILSVIEEVDHLKSLIKT